jgi:calcineurin-like phosphoesterase family protein
MHGDESRLYDAQWRKLKPGDILIICGDFGYLWDGGKREKSVIEYLGSRKFTVCFVDGTHENFKKIYKCRETIWKGGHVHRVSGNLLHLMRGQIFTIENYRTNRYNKNNSSDNLK